MDDLHLFYCCYVGEIAVKLAFFKACDVHVSTACPLLTHPTEVGKKF